MTDDVPIVKRPTHRTSPLIVKIDLSEHECPACRSSGRWNIITSAEPPSNNPELRVLCDCGAGELRIIVE
jgi:hypothetical protein